MGFSISYVFEGFWELLPYVSTTFWMTVCAIFCGLAGAAALTWLRFSSRAIVRHMAVAYVAVMRGTPALLLMFLVYYGLPLLLQSVQIYLEDTDQMVYAVTALSLSGAAYFSEAMRSAYLAVDWRQMEAGLSIGMNKISVICHVMLPQAIVYALPNFGNVCISTIKNSSLVYAIGITDVYQEGQKLAGATFGVRQLEIFVAVTAIYWLVCAVIEFAVDYFERRSRYFLPD